MTNVFQKAVRQKSKLRLALMGVSGSGKTYSALRLAKGLGGKIAFIDTESGSAQLYSNIADFDVLELGPPYTPTSYVNAIRAAEEADYEVLIIDSLSHAWAGEGGVLDRVEKITEASRSKNSFQAWNKGTKEQNMLVDKILSSNLHVICCIRSKTAYEIVEDNGKKRPVKFGLAPVQRDNLEYEFSLVMDISRDNHLATVSKNRTDLFNDEVPFMITEDTGKQLNKWLDSGIIAPVKKGVDEVIIDKIYKCNSVTELSTLYKDLATDPATSTWIQDLVGVCAKRKQEILRAEETQLASEDIQW